MPTRYQSIDALKRGAEAILMEFLRAKDFGWGAKHIRLVPSNYISVGQKKGYFLETLKQLKNHLKSIKDIKYNKSLDGRHFDVIYVEVDEKKIENEIESFLQHVSERNRLIAKDEEGKFWFNINREMIPKKTNSAYWKFFTALYDTAMNGEEDENHYFLAPYKNLRRVMIKRKIISKFLEDKKIKEKIRNFIKDQFRRRPQSFGISQKTFQGNEIIKIEEGEGVKLYNPLL